MNRFEHNNQSLRPLHTLSINVFYEDTDASGNVYHARYLHFLERSRSLFLKSLGLTYTSCIERYRIQFVVSDFSIRYRHPAQLDNVLSVILNNVEIKMARMLFTQTIEHESQILTTSLCTVACIKDQRPTRIPIPIVNAVRQGRNC